MRRLLFMMLTMLSVFAVGDVWAGSSVGVFSNSNLTITIDDDPGLENYSGNDINWVNGGGTFYIKGTQLNQAGLDKINSELPNKVVSLDLTGSTTKGEDWTGIPDCFGKILFAPGVTLPSERVLSTGKNLRYAYSADNADEDGVEINLFVGTVTSLDDITELTSVSLDDKTIVNLTGDKTGAIKAALIAKGVVETNIKTPVAPVDKNTLSTTVENLKADVQAFVEANGKDALKKLIITEGEITQDILNYLATELADIQTLDLTNATLPDEVRMHDGTTVNWEVFILPKGTKISPNFNCYPNLKYAMGGGFNKIWLVSQRGRGESTAFGSMLGMIPQEIKEQSAEARIGVAFVGEVTVEDVIGVVGTWDAPLANARIWHFDAAEGLEVNDFKSIAEATMGNNEIPTGFVLPRGLSLDEVYGVISASGQGHKIGNIYSLSKDGVKLNVQINKTETFDIARFTTMNTRIAVLKGATVDEYIVNALKGTKRAVSVDLSGMAFPNKSDEILSGVTSGSVKVVRLPQIDCAFDITHYAGTTFGVVSRIKTEVDINVAVSYQRVPGTLNKVREFRSSDIINCERIRYRGVMNMHDIENIFTGENSNTNTYYDLSDVRLVKYVNGTVDEDKDPIDFKEDMITDRTVEDGRDMSVLKNDYVKYIALPEGTALPDADAIKANCPQLLAMGVIDNGTKTLSTYSWENLNEEKAQISSVRQVTDMFDKEQGGDLVERKDIENVVMSGTLNELDVRTNSQDVTREKEFGLQGATGVKAIDWSGAKFLDANDMVLQNAGIGGNLTDIKLPLAMTEIPAEFMSGCQNVKELYIPEGYTIVGKDAFKGTNLSHIYTDEVKGDNGEGTITLPSSLTKICTGAFSLSDQVLITDVYVLSIEAPECEIDAFSSVMYFNNNSYNPVVPICQDSYQKGGGTSAMSVLHFPVECNAAEVRKYTDPTRDYTLGDGLGTTDAKGNLIYWPNQSEFNTAYIQAVCGYTWDSWKIERAGYSSEISNCLAPAGSGGTAVLEGNKEDADAKYAENGSPVETVFYDPESSDKNVDYRGWHQFVLTSYSKGKDADPTFNFGKINDNSWWTICLPFGLTKTDIESIYGEGTVVCTLEDVIRNYANHSITLVFGNNLMNDAEGGNVIKAGYPYMIKPNIPEGKTPSEFILSSEKYKPEIPEGEDGAYAILKKDFDVVAHKEDKTEDTGYTYKFVGSFAPYYIPPYSYFLAWDSKNSRPAYFYQSEMAAKDNRNWNPYTCIVTVNWNNPEWILADPKSNTVAHWNAITVVNGTDIAINCTDDSFVVQGTAAGAKTTNMVFGETGTTDINTVHTANGTVDFASGKVYNLNGQVVREEGCLSGLAKGVYVVNGKKYVKN